MAMEEGGLGTLDVEMSKEKSSGTMASRDETSNKARAFGDSNASATGNENKYEGGNDESNHNPNEENECDENGEERNVGSLENGGRGANGRRVSYFYDCE